jgi:predicted CoA-substrate-specific enzyme activase
MEYSLGIDIGSSSIKALLLDCHNKVIYRDYKTISTSSLECLKQILTKLKASLPIDQISHTGYSGGIDVNLDNLGWFRFTDSLAIARGVLHRHPDAGSIIYIGGQTILVIELEDGLNKPWKAITNPLCAAGTGRFMEQQAYRLGVDMEEFSSLALAFNGQSPRIATRCSVFAKSDLIHLQQKGVAVEAMLYALCESIGRMVVSLKKGTFKEPVYLVGGVAANKAVHQALSGNISRKNGKPVFIHILMTLSTQRH